MGIRLARMIMTHGECVQPLQRVKLSWGMSGMDPHTISEPRMGFWLSLGLCCVEVYLLGCWSVTVRLRDVIEVAIFEELSSLPVY
jgi:hypothetical protein